MEKPLNILFIVPYVPNLIRVRPYNIIRALSAKGHRITLVTLVNSSADAQDIEGIKSFCHEVVAFPLPRWRSLLNCVLTLPKSTPLQAVYCWQPDMMQGIEKLIIGQTFDVVHVEHLRGAEYGLNIKSRGKIITSQYMPVIWDSVDCISLLFGLAARQSKRLFSRLLTQFELARTRRYEGGVVRCFDHTIVTSAMDQAAFFNLIPGKANAPISVIPNGVDLDYFSPGDPASWQKNTLVISGKMSYHANVSMVLNFVEHTMPLIWREAPDVTLWVVGKDPTPEITALNKDQRIIITGTVADIRPYLRKAAVAVAPLTYGVGIQNKVLEAMACGTPVVCSTQAVSALTAVVGQDVITADLPDDLAKKIIGVLSNENMRHTVGAAGRLYVENYHRWNKLADDLIAIYRQSTVNRLAII